MGSNLFTPTVLQLHQFPQDEDISLQLYKKIGGRGKGEALLRTYCKCDTKQQPQV